MSSSRRQTGFALDSFFIRKLQVMDVFFEETDWLCSQFFFIRKLRVMDVFLEETDWLCSPGTTFAPLGESHGEGTNTHTDRHHTYEKESA